MSAGRSEETLEFGKALLIEVPEGSRRGWGRMVLGMAAVVAIVSALLAAGCVAQRSVVGGVAVLGVEVAALVLIGRGWLAAWRGDR